MPNITTQNKTKKRVQQQQQPQQQPRAKEDNKQSKRAWEETDINESTHDKLLSRRLLL
jgi:monoamine oxidase